MPQFDMQTGALLDMPPAVRSDNQTGAGSSCDATSIPRPVPESLRYPYLVVFARHPLEVRPFRSVFLAHNKDLARIVHNPDFQMEAVESRSQSFTTMIHPDDKDQCYYLYLKVERSKFSKIGPLYTTISSKPLP
jgi:hypothetical protein